MCLYRVVRACIFINKPNGGREMKFCSNCGTQLEDSVKFCGGCGAAQEVAQPQQNFTYEQPVANTQPAQSNGGFNGVIEKGKKITGGKIWLLPVALVAVIFVVWFVIFFFRTIIGSGAATMTGAVKNYYKAMEDLDAKDYINATMSNSMLKAIKESEDMTKKEIIEEMEEDFEDLEDWYGDDYEIKYKNIKIKDKDKLDKDDIEDFVDMIEDETDVKVSIQKMYEVEVSYREWDYYDEEWNKEETTLILYKSAGNWYVMDSFY